MNLTKTERRILAAEEMKDRAIRSISLLDYLILRKVKELSRTGRHLCGCGKPISKNKMQCLPCAEIPAEQNVAA